MKKTKKKSAIEAFLALPDAEKERQWREFDREFVGDTFRPLTPAQRKLWERAKRKRGRPRQGKGAKVISVSVEKDLLDRSDELAKRWRISRARLIAMGLENMLNLKRAG